MLLFIFAQRLDVDVDVTEDLCYNIKKYERAYLMRDLEFYSWLVETKQLSNRAAKDVISRCKRIKNILHTDSLDMFSSEQLLEADGFRSLSMFIKSQLKRALALWKEYVEVCQKNN